MSTKKRIAKNTFIQVVGKALATVLGVITIGVMTRLLGVEAYGELTLAITFLSLFAILVDFGLTLTTVQMISEDGADEKHILGNMLSLRIISSVLFLGAAPLIALALPYTNIVHLMIAVGTISFFFSTTSQMLTGVFQKRLVMWQVVIAELCNRVAVLVGMLLAPTLGIGLLGVMWILVIGNGIQMLLMLMYAWRHVGFGLRWDTGLLRNIISRSWPIGASIFFNLLYLKGDIIFLSFYRSSEEIGLYGAAYKVVDVMTHLPVLYMGLVLPLLIMAFSQKRKEAFASQLQQTFDLFALIAIPFFFGSILTATPMMELVAGADFTDAGKALTILGPTVSMIFFGSMYGHAIIAVKKQRAMLKWYACVAAFTIIGYLLLIPPFGYIGAAWMTFLSETLIIIPSFIIVYRESGFLPSFKKSGQYLLAAFLMSILVLFIISWPVYVVVPVGIAAYVLILELSGVFRLRDALRLFAPGQSSEE